MLKRIINRETILYIVFGIGTTVVNFGTFVVADRVLGDKFYLISNILSFICATLFAFTTNKCFVFESRSWNKTIWIKELITFVMSRIVTFLVIEEFGLFFLVSVCKITKIKLIYIDGKLLAKIILSFVAVLANYVFGKFFVFKKDR